MGKPADYYIAAVRYNSAHTHIDSVKSCKSNDDGSLGSFFYENRSDVITKIKNGWSYITIVQESDGKWYIGQPVRIITVKWTEYIKTVDNGKEEDNLENLPEF
jgi:hypothetical protein